ncbi:MULTISPECIES: hypothetical protein [Pseudomonas]|uniref:hypothetical protein n=1 Tax=Pseudomonas TaxID=286 RepID=UPI0018E5EC0A|nr:MULTISPECIES: hypothetical protein [Pseudomonas]MBI6658001.1 hypothetical protein [Pseudomonas carnis]MBI6660483.1 hypothetical protein [Pseudomonas carnis]MBI6686604.1 hypothetical protein [Pseudomonas carnis]MBL4980518.1 hypothetical protein [Pseudomonas fluorescens]
MAASMVDGCWASYTVKRRVEAAGCREVYLDVNCFFSVYSKLGIVVWPIRPTSDVVYVISFRKTTKRRLKIMTRKPSSVRLDTVNPEWSTEHFAKAKPASEVFVRLFGRVQAKEMLKLKRGGPTGS